MRLAYAGWSASLQKSWCPLLTSSLAIGLAFEACNVQSCLLLAISGCHSASLAAYSAANPEHFVVHRLGRSVAESLDSDLHTQPDPSLSLCAGWLARL